MHKGNNSTSAYRKHVHYAIQSDEVHQPSRWQVWCYINIYAKLYMANLKTRNLGSLSQLLQ